MNAEASPGVRGELCGSLVQAVGKGWVMQWRPSGVHGEGLPPQAGGGVITSVISVPIMHCKFARWAGGCDLDQHRGDEVQGDCVVGREFLEGPVFGCPGVALAVQCG